MYNLFGVRCMKKSGGLYETTHIFDFPGLQTCVLWSVYLISFFFMNL